MGDSAETGVIDHRHRVFGYEGLFVVDGSAISANVGVNPSLTICALSERAMTFIEPIVLSPEDLVVRLVAAIPPPRFHLVRYFGILSSHSRCRREVVPRSPPEPTAIRPAPAAGDQLELALVERDDEAEPPRRNRWAWLIAHVFRADVETCARCGGPMRWVEAAASRKSAARLLAKLGLAPQPPPEHAPTPFGQLGLSFGR
jgi:hypothetical protein